MKLYLMRHGQAASKEIDPEQGLTINGKRAIEQLAIKLAQQGMSFDQAFHSGKARAQQTAEIMTRIIAPHASLTYRENLKPDDGPEELLSDINTWQKDTLITSHLPFIPNLLSLLTSTSQYIGFEPGTIVCLSKQGTEWHLEWITSPDPAN